jgi:hypothetical protein
MHFAEVLVHSLLELNFNAHAQNNNASHTRRQNGYVRFCNIVRYRIVIIKYYYIRCQDAKMFGKQKGKRKTEENEKPQTIEKPSGEAESASKLYQLAENITPPVESHAEVEVQKSRSLVIIKEYSSAVEIAERIDKEIAEAKSALGEQLRQLHEARYAAEKLERLHNIVSKATGKKIPKENPNRLEVNGLEIILDATPLNELAAIETVVRSHQQRLLSLQKVKESLGSLDPLCNTEGLKYLVLEKEGIPEQIMLRFS